ncbi:hypothetical protein BW86_04595, partial [Escherichia coli O26:H11 str. 06-3464]
NAMNCASLASPLNAVWRRVVISSCGSTESMPTRSASFPASVASAVLIRFIPLNQYQPGGEQWFQPCTGCVLPCAPETQHRHQTHG